MSSGAVVEFGAKCLVNYVIRASLVAAAAADTCGDASDLWLVWDALIAITNEHVANDSQLIPR